MSGFVDDAQTVVLRDRFRGCLLGLAVGDALGMPLEGMRPEEIRHKYGIVNDYLDGQNGFKAGEGTDDTYQMLAVAESYIEYGGFNREDIANRFITWFQNDGRGIGRTTRIVLSAMAEGISSEEATINAIRQLGDNAAGNGSLMRCAPTGLLRFRNTQLLTKESENISSITHADRRCIDSCVLMNRAIAYLLGDLQHVPLLPYLLSNSQSLDPQVHSCVAALTTLKPFNLRTGGFVLETLQAGLWAVIHSRNFEEGMIALLTMGGDTDTTCAIGGALLGVRFGEKNIPKRWLDGLVLRERVCSAAEGLFDLFSKSSNV